MKFRVNQSITAASLFLLLFSAGAYSVDAPTKLTQQYMKVFTENAAVQQQIEVLNQLQWAGLSDPRLFDLIEQRLLDLYPVAKGDDAELASWYAKSLGTSGLEKYRSSLEGIVDSKANKKVRKYAGEGLNNIGRYAVWNPIIASTVNARSDKPEQVNAFANMLRSEDWLLRNMAAKRVYADNVYDDYLLDTLEAALKKEYVIDHTGNLQVKTTAWMARALASSHMPQYRATLEDMAQNAPSSKLRSYARKYLKNF